TDEELGDAVRVAVRRELHDDGDDRDGDPEDGGHDLGGVAEHLLRRDRIGVEQPIPEARELPLGVDPQHEHREGEERTEQDREGEKPSARDAAERDGIHVGAILHGARRAAEPKPSPVRVQSLHRVAPLTTFVGPSSRARPMSEMMQSQSTEPVSAAPAREALAWAVRLSENPDTAGPRPEKPTAASWGALSVAELRAGLDELLVKRNVEDALEALQELGALAAWIPELEAMVGFGDGEWRHKDVWKHTKQVVKQSVPRLEVRWGALLHDIGKPKTRKITDDGQVTFYGHSEVGAAMFRRKVRKRLGFEGELAERVHFLILNHLRASQYETTWTDAAVRRF